MSIAAIVDSANDFAGRATPLLVVFVFGPGRWSLDAWLGRRGR